MNKHLHRLVFDRRRGMRVATAETARSASKAAGGGSRACGGASSGQARAISAVLSMSVAVGQVMAAPAIPRVSAIMATRNVPNLPEPMSSSHPNVGRAPVDSQRFVQSGSVKYVLVRPDGKPTELSGDARQMVINQSTSKAILNWGSFNIGKGNTVEFRQPTGGSTLNYIWDANPSVINGALKANGEVILQNTNGVIFGPNATVDTGKLVATALQLDKALYEKGFRGNVAGEKAFGGQDASPDGFVSIERGAEIRTAAGGEVLIMAPRVVNEGRIETPGGQTVMAAGQTVYLANSLDKNQRGLLVAVDSLKLDDPDLNTVEQAAAKSYQTTDSQGQSVIRTNEVVAERGSINLVAKVIRQNGHLKATTAVKGENGAIYLQAQDQSSAAAINIPGSTTEKYRAAATGGTVILGQGSVTEVTPDTQGATQLQAEAFTPSRIEVEGKVIVVESQATLRASSGDVRLIATERPESSELGHGVAGARVADESRVVIQKNAVIDVSGLKDVALKMSTNLIDAQLFQSELSDSPVQRNTPVYRADVVFDARLPRRLANVEGYVNQVPHSVQEQMLKGGRITVLADGAVVTDKGATLDISGGNVLYEAGQVRQTTLLRVGDHYVDFANADPGVRYDKVINSPGTHLALGYRQGADAGTATLAAPRMWGLPRVAGSVVVGPRQRGDSSASATPLAGQLMLGQSYYDPTAATSKEAHQVLKALTITSQPSDAGPADFLSDVTRAPVALIPETLQVSAADLLAGGVSRLSLAASQVVQARLADLNLGSGGALSIDANRIEMNAALHAAGGQVKLMARQGDIVFGAQSMVDLAGNWTNDRASAASPASSTMALNGGSLEALAFGDVNVATGALLDVSAGAWLPSTGSVKTGAAGSISLSAGSYYNVFEGKDQGKPARLANSTNDPLRDDKSTDELGAVKLAGDLHGFGFGSGGALTVRTGAIVLADEPDSGRGLTLNPGFFSNNGFSSFDLSAAGAVTVAAGTQVDARLKNLVLTNRAQALPSGALSGKIVQTETLPQAQRQAVKLNLATVFADGNSTNFDLKVGRAARLSTDAGGAIGLTATGSVVVDGELIAPGGAINLSITGNRGLLGDGTRSDNPSTGVFDRQQSIWLGSSARLSVAGKARTTPDALGRLRGDVLAGGQINLEADKGYVVAQAGSVMDLSGIQSTLYVNGLPTAQQVTRPAGSLSVSTPEGFALEGSVLAASPGGAASGGTVTLNVTLNGRNPSGNESLGYDALDRRIDLSSDPRPLLGSVDGPAQWGQDLAATLGHGVGRISAKALTDAGFADVKLLADDRITLADAVNLDLSRGRALTLNTRAIEGLGDGQSILSAPYVSLGDRDLPFQSIPAFAPDTSASAGQAALTVRAGLIESAGIWGARGFEHLTLDASQAGTRTDGEVRFVGRVYDVNTVKSDAALKGGLNFAGTLDLRGGLIDASSVSAITVKGLTSTPSKILTSAPGGTSSATPLTALASMTWIADAIDHQGVIKLPFGQLNLDTADLVLGPQSLLSTSGRSLTVPLGSTVNGERWLFSPLQNAAADLKGKIDLGVAVGKGQSIVLKAGALHMDSEARLDLSGGGDIQASEFVKGVGGSTDYLARPDVFAVVKNWQGDFGAYDAELAQGSTLKPGAQIEITMPGSGLAPGRYTLLPAKYALLPGAFVVSMAKDQGSSALQRPIQSDDGSSLVTGYFTTVGSSVAGDPGQRILVEPSSTYLAKSKYVLTSANQLRATQAAREGRVLNRPSDAGALTLAVQQPFDLQGHLDFKAPTGSSSGTLDLAVKDGDIAVVDAWSDSSDAWTRIRADVLHDIGNPSVLLGGTRTLSDKGLDVNVVGHSVSVLANDADLSAGEWLLAGKGAVHLGEGVSLVAKATADGTPGVLTFNGNQPSEGALFMLSGRTGLSVSRLALVHGQGTSLAMGELSMAPTASLTGAALQLDASGTLSLTEGVALGKGMTTLGLSGPRLALGGDEAEELGVAHVQGSWLSALTRMKSIQLRAYSAIDFIDGPQLGGLNGDQQANLQELILDTPLLRGLGDPSKTTLLRAEQLTWLNSSGLVADQTLALAGHGTVHLQALPRLMGGVIGGLQLGGATSPAKNLAVPSLTLGFDQATLASSGDIVFVGQSPLNAPGDLTLSSSRVTALSGAEASIQAGGRLTIKRPESDEQVLPTFNRLGQGAAVSFNADRIEQLGFIDLPSGQLNLEARGLAGLTEDHTDSIRFGANSVTSVAGFTWDTGDGWSTQGNAGNVQVRSLRGQVVLDGTLDVSAGTGLAGGSRAGLLSVVAEGRDGSSGDLILADEGRWQFKAAARDAVSSGAFQADAATIQTRDTSSTASLDPLATALLRAGAQRDIELRIRQGDVGLSEGATLKAQRVMVGADAGALTIGGVVDAAAPQGGVVQLTAGLDLTLGQKAQVLASSSRSGANGGDVLLATANGVMRLASTAVVDASGDGADDGRIVLRMPLAQDDLTLNRMPGEADAPAASVAALLKAAKVDVEAVTTYRYKALSNVHDERTGTLGLNRLQDDWQPVSDNAQALLTTLGLDGLPQARLVQGVEIISDGDFTIKRGGPNGDLDLREAFSGRPGFLTIRAARNLAINASLSDGFDAGGQNVDMDGSAWSYRLTAGADTLAANPLQTTLGSASAGHLTVASNTVVRTTSGSIEMNASGNVQLLSQDGQAASGTVYVAGQSVAAAGTSTFGDPLYKYRALKEIPPDASKDEVKAIDAENELINAYNSEQQLGYDVDTATFTRQGGRLEVHAAADVISAAPRQGFSAWYNSAGFPDDPYGSVNELSVSLAWWSNVGSFRQGFGSFGGGNVLVDAGGNVSNLTVVAPTSGRVGKNDWATLAPIIENGGDITIRAGRDIQGGTYWLGRGQGLLQAGRDLRVGQATSAPDGAILGLSDGSWNVLARGNLTLSAVVNPTALIPSTGNDGHSGVLFVSYAPDSEVSLQSMSGDINWKSPTVAAWKALGLNGSVDGEMEVSGPGYAAYNLAPPKVKVAALSGSVNLGSATDIATILTPSAQGQLSVFAGKDLSLGKLAMADFDPTVLPGLQGSAQTVSTFDALYTGNDGLLHNLSNNADVNQLFISSADPLNPEALGVVNLTVDKFTGLHADDAEPAHLHAGGSIRMNGTSSYLVLPKAATVVAGLDINDLNMIGQNLGDADVTLVKAGRDLLMTSISGRIAVGGAGLLDVEAGRYLDLGSSVGIETVGNLYNTRLPEQGAAVVVGGGMAGQLNTGVFLSRYLGEKDASPDAQANRASLIAFIQGLGLPAGTFGQASEQFAALPAEQQTLFARKVLSRQLLSTYVGSTADLTPAMKQTMRLDLVRYVRFLDGVAPDAWPDDAAQNRTALLAQYPAALARFKALPFDRQFALYPYSEIHRGDHSSSDANPSGVGVKPYAWLWQALTEANGLSASPAESAWTERFSRAVMFAEIRGWGDQAAGLPKGAQRDQTYANAFSAIDLAGLGGSFTFAGSVDLVNSKVHTKQGGLIQLLSPGGDINVGASNEVLADISNPNKDFGVVSYGNGGIQAMSSGDFQVNTKKAFSVGLGDMVLWSSKGDINSGLGANTAIALAATKVHKDADGNVTFLPPEVIAGSGLGNINVPEALDKRDLPSVHLLAPVGEILAMDSFIRSPGKVVLGAEAVRGADNIKGGSVSGAVVTPTVSLALNTTTATNQPPTAAGPASLNDTNSAQKERNALLTVDLLGLGEPGAGVDPTQETDDKPCLPGDKRPKCSPHEKAK